MSVAATAADESLRIAPPSHPSVGACPTADLRASVVSTIDVDGLKKVNDADGHDAGDRLSRRFATGVSERLGMTFELYRWGGDEFYVLASGHPAETASTLAAAQVDLAEIVHFSWGIAMVENIDLFRGCDEGRGPRDVHYEGGPQASLPREGEGSVPRCRADFSWQHARAVERLRGGVPRRRGRAHRESSADIARTICMTQLN